MQMRMLDLDGVVHLLRSEANRAGGRSTAANIGASAGRASIPIPESLWSAAGHEPLETHRCSPAPSHLGPCNFRTPRTISYALLFIASDRKYGTARRRVHTHAEPADGTHRYQRVEAPHARRHPISQA